MDALELFNEKSGRDIFDYDEIYNVVEKIRNLKSKISLADEFEAEMLSDEIDDLREQLPFMSEINEAQNIISTDITDYDLDVDRATEIYRWIDDQLFELASVEDVIQTV